ncbi:hypothetical protein GGS20DRAFT_584017 [Poronia punctata]|nr:hypothetical protein GGS20DRAFT_584017 [Poronia punctata]
MNEIGSNMSSERRPACDNCRTRKVCSEVRTLMDHCIVAKVFLYGLGDCATLGVACRVTGRSGEKRQRVLLSSKYEEAVQDVGRQLAEVKGMLESLTSNRDAAVSLAPPKTVSGDGRAYTPQSMIDEQLPTLEGVQEGYHGDSSFISHAHQIRTTLEHTLLPSDLEFSPPSLPKSKDQDRDTGTTTTSVNPAVRPVGIEAMDMPLPPNDVVLKLLRLLKSEEQRFFIDMPLFERDEFIDMCRDIYFATEPISLWTWISVNVGLYNLFIGVREESVWRLGTTGEALRAYTAILKSNSEASMQSLRMCSEPSGEYCRALAVLANFYVRQGHSTIAWRLISGAARGALDLGLHRLPSDTNTTSVPKDIGIFWHIYTWERGLAMTCGKSPTIRHSDVTSGLHLLAWPRDTSCQQNILYSAFVDMAVAMGEIQECLFSVVAQQSSQHTRVQHAKRLASCLADILTSVKRVSPDEPSWDGLYSRQVPGHSHHGGIVTTLDIVLHSQLAIVYRFLPAGSRNAHPLQCAPECVSAARIALSTLAKVGEGGVKSSMTRWSTLLNTILSLVPLVPFIVLAGNAIATSSGEDLPLLSNVVSLLLPVVEESPLIRKVYGACESLSKVAERVVSRVGQLDLHEPVQDLTQLQSQSASPHVTGDVRFDYAFPMGQQDWDSLMTGFGSEFGDYGSRALSNIFEPCFANTYW